MAETPRPRLHDSGLKWGRSTTNHAGTFSESRAVLLVDGRPWSWQPEYCLNASPFGEWFDGGRVLVCPGCGLDMT